MPPSFYLYAMIQLLANIIKGPCPYPFYNRTECRETDN